MRSCGSYGVLLSMLAALASGGDPAAVRASHYDGCAASGPADEAPGGPVSELSLVLDVGGRALPVAAVSVPPLVARLAHGSVEVVYVLTGTFEHEENGRRRRLTPGMVGIVRPGDGMRDLVPGSGALRLLVTWSPPDWTDGPGAYR
jgi:quercetin dioxygenase-like cupin family protein